MPSVLPRVGAAPVLSETLLRNLHLLPHRCLGIGLHTRVDRSIDSQSVGIKVQLVDSIVTRHMTLRAEVVDVTLERLAEIGCHAVLITLIDTHLESNGQRCQRIQLGSRCLLTVDEKMMMVIDKLQDCVAALETVMGVEPRVVVAGSLEQPHQGGCLLVVEGIGHRAKISAGCRLDTVGIASEIDRIEVHGQYLFLREHPLKLQRHNPLLSLHDQYPDARQMPQQARGILRADTEHVLCQLLGDCAGSSGMTTKDVLHGREKTDDIDAMMLIETLVLCIDKGTYQDGRYLLIGDRRTVLVKVAPHQDFVAGIDLRCFVDNRVLDVIKARRTSEEIAEVEIDRYKEQYDDGSDGGKPDGCLLVPRAGKE